MPTQKGVGWNSSWGRQGPTEHSHILVTEASPSGVRQWSLLLQAPVCLASALTLLEAVGLPTKFTSRPRLDSLPGGHSRALASLQVDRLDASENLRKQEEHVVEPTPLLFGRWHSITCPLSPREGRQFIPPCPGWASDWGGN